MLPKDPYMLLSVVNTALRDRGIDLEEFCRSEGCDRKELEERISAAGLTYDAEKNCFG